MVHELWPNFDQLIDAKGQCSGPLYTLKSKRRILQVKIKQTNKQTNKQKKTEFISFDDSEQENDDDDDDDDEDNEESVNIEHSACECGNEPLASIKCGELLD